MDRMDNTAQASTLPELIGINTAAVRGLIFPAAASAPATKL